jgi:hypothetical protein
VAHVNWKSSSSFKNWVRHLCCLHSPFLLSAAANSLVVNISVNEDSSFDLLLQRPSHSENSFCSLGHPLWNTHFLKITRAILSRSTIICRHVDKHILRRRNALSGIPLHPRHLPRAPGRHHCLRIRSYPLASSSSRRYSTRGRYDHRLHRRYGSVLHLLLLCSSAIPTNLDFGSRIIVTYSNEQVCLVCPLVVNVLPRVRLRNLVSSYHRRHRSRHHTLYQSSTQTS